MKKNFTLLIICSVFIAIFLLFGANNSKYLQSENNVISSNGLISNSGVLKQIQADSIAPDHSEMSYLTSVEFAKQMVPEWNVGNSLDAIGGETAWGNPKINQRLIDSVKAAGFNAIRIPVAWSKFTDTSTCAIDTTRLNRVEEVVNYVLQDSMYAIINEHWDNGWIQPTYAHQEYVNNRLAAMWHQIAIHFRDYDDHLVFAGTNEVMVEGDYSTPKEEYYTVQNGYNQTFVSTVRSTGGRNYYRYLIVQGFNTNIDYTVNFFQTPTDVTEDRLMVEVHYFDPYNFTLNSNSSITQWGDDATNPTKTESWANESWADGQFNKMKTNFVDEGYAVILGEYGVIARLNLGSPDLNEEFAGYRRYYIEYITGSIFKHGLVPFLWDNGYTGNNGMGVFDRTTGSPIFPDIIEAIMNALDTTKVHINMNSLNSIPNEYCLMQNFPNPFNPSTTITYSLPQISSISLNIYDNRGCKVANIIDDEKKERGAHLIVFNAYALASGTYFCKLDADDYSETIKMLLVK